MNTMTDGILLIDKPAQMTSFGVVARVRRVLSRQAGKKVKVGHTGTLDPFATGLMIIVVGKECRNAAAYSKLDKSYLAEITLGATSTTADPEGDITPHPSDIIPSQEDIEITLRAFRGPISQTPPRFSAIKVGGVRAYKLARAGEDVELPRRQVTVHALDIVAYDFPRLRVRAHVSSGTYIRSLAVDIGEALGTGAYLSALRRETVGKYKVGQAVRLDDFLARFQVPAK